MNQPAQIRNLLTSAAERQRQQRLAMAQTSEEIAKERANSAQPEQPETQSQS